MDQRLRSGGVRDGHDRSLRWPVVGVAALAVLVRGTVWPLSNFVVGPTFGALPFALLPDVWSARGSMIVEGTLAGLILITAAVIAIGSGLDPARWARPARIFGAVAAAQTLAYTASTVIAARLFGGPELLDRLAWTLGVVAALNVSVFILGLSLAWPAFDRMLRSAGRP